ncbi:lipopolysaccharide export system permease protein [Arenibacter nanhaiticus]|uniref:Lipopolysaccharide export system permease protein n=2 Tax=Arenibacter nanhaiticus TaxID=558155 RepID=A0A1M6FLS5_9FLAO|nr:LptF/LptG family permease [Arenibacter nanhaiticus]SHI98603.1 lipopolysaccharide export system permease protein [Arenibacter nanhaiticus]
MRILDRYILSSFLYNFFSSFFILMFIFIFQTIWLFIDDFAGKGLDIFIIGKFMFYLMPNLMERVIPLTVLLSSILTFGSFAENYEFAAMKASGISLQRSMLSLIIFVTFLGGVTFYFANNIIPLSEQKIYNLRRNIAKVKPAAIISEGVFSDLEGTDMNMKVDRKHGEKDRFLENVIIHQKSRTNVNTTVIKAESGELISSEDSDLLQLVLKDGHYYKEMEPKSNKNKNKHPFTKADFKTYTINKDLSDLNNVDMNEERDVSTDKMKNISRLSKDIDSLKKDNIKVVNAFSKNIVNRMGAFMVVEKPDSITMARIEEKRAQKPRPRFSDLAQIPTDSIVALFPEWQTAQIIGSAKTATSNILTTIKGKKKELQLKYKIYNLHILSLHKKYALALSCIILFFVGAPLGAIIRKGGLGLPMVIAIVLFLTYYFIGVFAGNYAKEGNIDPVLGAWLSTCIMLPLGIFLTRRATADKGLISIGSIIDYIKKLITKKRKISTT